MELEEFKNQARVGVGRRKVAITNSWGVYDAYKLARKNGWYNIGKAVSEKDFYAIVRSVNKLIADEIAMGHTVKFPEGMGHLELRKRETGVSIVNGKLKNTYPVDWSETWKLWFEDADAYEKKLLIRDEQPFVYYIKYLKFPATYNNKTFYQFRLNQFVKKALKQHIKQGKVDTLW